MSHYGERVTTRGASDGYRQSGTGTIRQGNPSAVDRVVRRALGAGQHRVVELAAVLAGSITGPVDVVRAADDAFALLAYERRLDAALRAALHVLRPGGILIAAVPELERLRRTRAAAPPPRVARAGDDREVTVSVWDWSGDGESYGLDVLQLVCQGGQWELGRVVSARHRVLTADDVGRSLAGAGFRAVRRLPPNETGHRAPLWLAAAPIAGRQGSEQ